MLATKRGPVHRQSWNNEAKSRPVGRPHLDVGSLCKAYKLYGSGGLCSLGESIFVWLKMIAPSWLKVVHPFADGDDVATRGLSIIWPTLGFNVQR